MNTKTALSHAQNLDSQDELAAFRQEFVITDPNLIYLDGNSLGRLPLKAQTQLQALVNQGWGDRLIRGWNEGWIDLSARIGGKIAGLIGAQPDEVLLADSTSVNLYKLALAALQKQNGRFTILTDDLNFPSDHYILQGICRLLGSSYRLQTVPSPDGIHGPAAALAAAINDDTALVALSATTFKSSYTYDLAALTRAAHEKGALVLWDLSHAVGALPINLNAAQADLAVGCTYKYLNGGPGAPAFLYVRHDLQAQLANPISGWMGQQAMFDFGLDYQPAPGLRRFITGTPPILSLAAIEPGVDLLLAAGMDRVRAKSVGLSHYLIELWQAWLEPLGFRLHSPRDAAQRGSHISLAHPDGWRINQALIHEMHVIPDFRAPDNLRLGLTPLYTSYEDVRTAVSHLRTVVTQNLHYKYIYTPDTVT
jgi:kynureninase